MKEVISEQKARSLVSALGWRKIQLGYTWIGKDKSGSWWVQSAGHFYERFRASKNW